MVFDLNRNEIKSLYGKNYKGEEADDKKVEESRKLLNPMNYIGTDKQADAADHIRCLLYTSGRSLPDPLGIIFLHNVPLHN